MFAIAFGGLCLVTGMTNALASPYDKIYSFGDSLSDVGNVYASTPLPGIPKQPIAPYVNGQFSNGPVWVQDLAAKLGLPALTPSLLGGTDFAYGSAETGTTLFHTADQADIVGATGQIAQYEAAGYAPDPNALYTLWIGSNDLQEMAAATSPVQIIFDLFSIVSNIDLAITELATDGAKHILVVGVPDIGVTPDGLSTGPAGSAQLSLLAAELNSTLENGVPPFGIPSLATIESTFGLDLNTLDTYSLLDNAVADPSAYGFTDVTDPCLTGEVNYGGGTACADPSQYLFWDGEHPTAAGHAFIADAADAEVDVPEPAPVSLIITGLLGLGFLIHRRGLADQK